MAEGALDCVLAFSFDISLFKACRSRTVQSGALCSKAFGLQLESGKDAINSSFDQLSLMCSLWHNCHQCCCGAMPTVPSWTNHSVPQLGQAGLYSVSISLQGIYPEDFLLQHSECPRLFLQSCACPAARQSSAIDKQAAHRQHSTCSSRMACAVLSLMPLKFLPYSSASCLRLRS